MSDVPTLLPPNATPIELEIEQSTARIGAVPICNGTLWSPATCPSALLPWLAWALSVDSWDSSWADATKRSVIAASPTVHRRKGTIGAVRQAVEALGGSVTIVEWFNQDPPGEPYTFELTLPITGEAGETVAADYLTSVIEAVEGAKNVRSHYTLTASLASASQLGLIGGAQAFTYRRMDFAAA